MPRTQLNVRVPETTLSQIEQLQRLGYESQSHTIIIAIDRLFKEESKMQYKGFSISTFSTIGGYGWSATSAEYGEMGRPNAGQNDSTTYTSADEAQQAAKTAITQFLDGYHYEGEAKFA